MKTLHCTPCEKDVEPVFEVGDTGPEGSLPEEGDSVDITIPLELNCPECGTTISHYTVDTSRVLDDSKLKPHALCFITDGDDYDPPEFKVVVEIDGEVETEPDWGAVPFVTRFTCQCGVTPLEVRETLNVPWDVRWNGTDWPPTNRIQE